jgi:hypothetical protein
LEFNIDPTIQGRKLDRLNQIVARLERDCSFDFPGEVNLALTDRSPHYDVTTNTIFLPNGFFTKWRLKTLRGKARTLSHEMFHYFDLNHLTWDQRRDLFRFMSGREPMNPDYYPYPWYRDHAVEVFWVNQSKPWEQRLVEQFAATCENTYWKDTTNWEWFNSAGACRFVVRPTDRRAEFKALVDSFVAVKAG